jgi:hypothetical protein
MTTTHSSILLLSLFAGLALGGCAASERSQPSTRFSVGPNPTIRSEPEPAGGFKVVQRYLTNGNQVVTSESLLLEPILDPGISPYQILIGPARDGAPFRAQVRNSTATLLMDSGFAAAVGHQPIVVVKRVVAAAEGTTFVVEGSGRGVYVSVLNADPAKPVRVYFDGDDASRPVLVGNWQYVRVPDHATRIPAAQPIPFPGSGLADPDDVGSLLRYSYAKRIQTGQTIQPTDADAQYLRLLAR